MSSPVSVRYPFQPRLSGYQSDNTRGPLANPRPILRLRTYTVLFFAHRSGLVLLSLRSSKAKRANAFAFPREITGAPFQGPVHRPLSLLMGMHKTHQPSQTPSSVPQVLLFQSFLFFPTYHPPYWEQSTFFLVGVFRASEDVSVPIF